MKILIIEDEQLAAVHLKNILKAISEDIEVCQTITSVKEAVEWFRKNDMPDLIFCDIELADGSAFTIFEQLKIETPVIFCTAYNEYAIKAFQTSGIHYILKPFTTADIHAALEKYHSLRRNMTPTHSTSYNELLSVLNAHGIKKSTTLLVNYKEKVIPVQLADIAVIYLADKLVRLQTMSGKSYLAGKSLDELEKMTGPDWFRVNRQCLIHRQAIEDVSYLLGRRLALNLTIPFETRITISREKASQFLQWLGEAT
jgi:two-component system, LytTR family, response regulator LytT